MVQSDYRTHFNALPHEVDGLKPMKEVLPEELVDLITVGEVNPALSIMLNPVDACVLELRRNTLLYSARVNFAQ
jgi:hypothetical protein